MTAGDTDQVDIFALREFLGEAQHRCRCPSWHVMPALLQGVSDTHDVHPAAVVRTSWVCGEHGSNMVATVLRLIGERDHLSFVDDQRGCPTFTADLAPALRQLAVERRSGIHHLTNARPVSWFEFVQEIVSAAGKDPSMVSPIATADLDPPRPAPRPMNSVLDNFVWRSAGCTPLRDHQAPLEELVAALHGRN